MKAVSVKTMRESDAACIAAGTPSKELMRRAGEAIFRAGKWRAPVAVVCGKGNNAGDGYVAAECLRKAGIGCRVFLLFESFSEDGRYFYDICIKNGIPSEKLTEETDLSAFGSVLDCILGTGFHGEPEGLVKTAIEKINESGAYVVSADINSGLNGDTGLGSTFVRSDLTVSIGSFKLGHFRGLADAAMKEKINCDIGIPITGPVEEV